MTTVVRRRAQLITWLFVAGVTLYDIAFALAHQDTAHYWEANPAMRWVMAALGIWAAAAIRAGTVAFAVVVVPRAPTRSRTPATAAAFAVHAYLAGAYTAIALSV